MQEYKIGVVKISYIEPIDCFILRHFLEHADIPTKIKLFLHAALESNIGFINNHRFNARSKIKSKWNEIKENHTHITVICMPENTKYSVSLDLSNNHTHVDQLHIPDI